MVFHYYIILLDLYVFDIFTNKWTLMECKGIAPSPRCSHTASVIGGKMYVFGGMNETEIFGDEFYLDLETWTWHTINEKEGDNITRPGKRNSHSATTIYDKYIAIFGGCYGTGKFLNDLWIYDCGCSKWSQISTITPPEPRLGHTLTTIDSRLYVFGGLAGKDATYRSELFAIDLSNVVPQLDEQYNSASPIPSSDTPFPGVYRWVGVPSNTHPPQPRLGHAAVAIGERLVLICGDTGHGLLADCVVGDTDLDAQQAHVSQWESKMEKASLEAEIERLRKELDMKN